MNTPWSAISRGAYKKQEKKKMYVQFQCVSEDLLVKEIFKKKTKKKQMFEFSFLRGIGNVFLKSKKNPPTTPPSVLWLISCNE